MQSSYDNGNSDQDSGTSDVASTAKQVNDARNAYVKQQLVFSTIDRMDLSEKV